MPPPGKKPSSSIPSPQALAAYSEIDPELPKIITMGAIRRDDHAYQYMRNGLFIGGAIAAGLICGFIYLIIQNHPTAAGALLSAAAIGMVSGFRNVRL